MAWSAPMTAIALSTFSAAEYNRYIRDNLLETAPGRWPGAASYYYTTYKTNGLAYRTMQESFIATTTSTTLHTYQDLTGPSVTSIPVGSAMIVFYAVRMSNSLLDCQARASVALTGPTNVSSRDDWGIVVDGRSATQSERVGGFHHFKGLKAGNYTAKIQYYELGGGTASFSDRQIVVMPL